MYSQNPRQKLVNSKVFSSRRVGAANPPIIQNSPEELKRLKQRVFSLFFLRYNDTWEPARKVCLFFGKTHRYVKKNGTIRVSSHGKQRLMDKYAFLNGLLGREELE